MYARGMSQRDIAAIIEEIYGFQLSHEQILNITDLRYGRSESLAHTAAEAILSFFLCRLHLRFYTDRTRYPSGSCLCNAGLRYQRV